MSILDNAIQAIQVGIEDFQSGSDARRKSALRNIHAGLLLVLKEKLSRMSGKDSDEALLKATVLPILSGKKISWKGSGPKTVDIQGIKQRFQSLGVKFDWEKFDRVTKIRNDVEHYYTSEAPLVIEGALSNCFALIRNFMMNELKVDLRRKVSKELWEALLAIGTVYDAERKACVNSHKYFKSESKVLDSRVAQAMCPDCGSDLIRFKPGTVSDCRACPEVFDREATIRAMVEAVYSGDDYDAAKEGHDPSSTDCPECSEPAFIAEEMICAICGESQEGECQRCFGPIPLGEIGNEYCGYCNHMMSKDD